MAPAPKWISREASHAVLVALCFVPGVSANDIAGMIGAGCASVVFFAIVIAYIAFGCNWYKWYGDLMTRKGKSKAPRLYLKKKKEEAKRRLANGSVKSTRSSARANGSVPSKHMDTDRRSQRVSWVQGGNRHSSHIYEDPYEEKETGITLGAEYEENFQIEAQLVDNEVLDVGPYKSMASNAKPTQGDVYPEPYIYTPSADATITRSSVASGGWVSSVNATSGPTRSEEGVAGPSTETSKFTNLDDILIHV